MLDLSYLFHGFAFIISAALWPVTMLGFWLYNLWAREARMTTNEFVTRMGIHLLILVGWSVAFVIALSRITAFWA